MAQPARRRDQAGKLYPPAIQRWVSLQTGTDSPYKRGHVGEQVKGKAEVKAAGDRLYLQFNWDNGKRRGLIDAHREGTMLVGKYINLTDPKVTRPWIGLIVSNQRIDGRWTGGRLDFRRYAGDLAAAYPQCT